MIELGLQKTRLARGRAVMEHQERTGPVKATADGRPDALPAAGDQHDLVVQRAPTRR